MNLHAKVRSAISGVLYFLEPGPREPSGRWNTKPTATYRGATYHTTLRDRAWTDRHVPDCPVTRAGVTRNLYLHRHFWQITEAMAARRGIPRRICAHMTNLDPFSGTELISWRLREANADVTAANLHHLVRQQAA